LRRHADHGRKVVVDQGKIFSLVRVEALRRLHREDIALVVRVDLGFGVRVGSIARAVARPPSMTGRSNGAFIVWKST
jgi:DNA transposition AAA+ family ATPase